MTVQFGLSGESAITSPGNPTLKNRIICGNDPVNRHDPLGLAERNGQLCQSDLYASWIDSDLKNGHYFKAAGDFFGAVLHGIKGASAQTGTEMVETRQQIDAQIINGAINPVFGGMVRSLQYCADLGRGVGLAPFQPVDTAKGVVKAPVLVPYNFGQSLGEFTIDPTPSKFFDIGENGANVALLLEGARSSGSLNVTTANGALRSGGRLPSTGVSSFDRLVHGTPTFDNWAANLTKRGYSVETQALAQGEAASIQGTRVVVDPAQFRYIDLLHESRHIGQISRLDGSWNNTATRALFERGAYEYELRLGARNRFSAEYIDWARSRISDYWTRSVQQRYSRSSTLQGLWR